MSERFMTKKQLPTGSSLHAASFRISDMTDTRGERAGFFIEPHADSDQGDSVDHQRLILQRADALASENRLKEAIDVFSMALRCGSVRPEQLGTLVDCILRNFNQPAGAESRSGQPGSLAGRDGDAFACPACRRFLAEPATAACGHSYCRRCSHLGLPSTCKVCGEDSCRRPGELRPNVVLCALLEKWFPVDVKLCKAVGQTEGLLRGKRYEEALALANVLTDANPNDVQVRASRAEALAGLGQYQLSLDDLEVCLTSAPSPEGYFRKATVLQEMGRADESLQVFLQCLALDEGFSQAKCAVELILHDLLSLDTGNVKVGLKETTQHTSPLLRRKTLVAETQEWSYPDQQQAAQCHPQHLAQAWAAPKDPVPDPLEPSCSESLERPGLSRAHSLRTHRLGGSVEEGLKRVYSAPQLGNQGTLLKRKLSTSDTGSCLVTSGGNKHKKQGVTGGTTHRTVPKELVDASDFECSLCMRLFYKPVTTPCGHTFCKNCLERCLDHTPQCPLCKESLKEYLASRKYRITSILDDLIKVFLSEEHLERQIVHTEETKELSDLRKNVPVFVCTMAYPTVPCPLHVFEPRYRLMIRRCMETGTCQFGMCISDAQKGFVDYGCMLHIRSVHFLPDGRSVVDTVGGKRFRVLSRDMKDGYCIADIEYLEDMKVNDAEELSKLQELHDQVYEQARSWFQNLKNRFRNQILQHFGPMPEREADIQATPNGPACCWWLLAVLPVDPRYQLSILSMTVLRERLLKIQQILTYLQSIPNE
ncbi:LON peptidase N-terminal domain and RING finger protein 1 [Denticeps clupeoides]|uniref:LON peptidase N-terminal domain and RING finger protein 1 n=1 Tax=Denticeps clupeoides TaxID=299321 RepID=A0AAY3ZY61_9TELE|nr:LON peptidase N-terminal domain and RING finger protein 1-like [Denticeps clupeoides]